MSRGVTAEEFYAFQRAKDYSMSDDLEHIWACCGLSDEKFCYIVNNYDDLCDMYL